MSLFAYTFTNFMPAKRNTDLNELILAQKN